MTRPRPLLLASGLAALAVAWAGPLPEWSLTRFAAHMTMHLLVVAVAAPLLALGLPEPVRRLPLAAAPVAAAVLELVVVWAWHAPVLHDLARASFGWLAAEQASFLAVGFLVWLAAFGGGRERTAAGIGGLMLTSMHMTLLGALLALAPRPLYAACAGVSEQQLGGLMMLGVGGLAYLLGGLFLLAGLLRREEPS